MDPSMYKCIIKHAGVQLPTKVVYTYLFDTYTTGCIHLQKEIYIYVPQIFWFLWFLNSHLRYFKISASRKSSSRLISHSSKSLGSVSWTKNTIRRAVSRQRNTGSRPVVGPKQCWRPHIFNSQNYSSKPVGNTDCHLFFLCACFILPTFPVSLLASGMQP
jgi:hypothetical protein